MLKPPVKYKHHQTGKVGKYQREKSPRLDPAAFSLLCLLQLQARSPQFSGVFKPPAQAPAAKAGTCVLESNVLQVKNLLALICLMLEVLLPQNQHSLFHCSDADQIQVHELIQHECVVIAISCSNKYSKKSSCNLPESWTILTGTKTSPFHLSAVLHLCYSLCALKESLMLFLVRIWLSALVRI